MLESILVFIIIVGTAGHMSQTAAQPATIDDRAAVCREAQTEELGEDGVSSEFEECMNDET
jgi:hypothetical protein